MSLPRLYSFALLGSVLALALLGCGAGAGEASDGTSDELRALTADEVIGEIHYGETVEIAYTSTPRYRAYWFEGTKGDWLDVVVTAEAGSPGAFVTDDQFRSVRRGTKAVLPHTGKYYIAVREWDLQPTTLTVKFTKHVAAPGETPPQD